MKLRHLALSALLLSGCPEAQLPAKSTPPVPTEERPTPAAAPTARPTATAPALPPPGMRTTIGDKRVDDSWDKMVVAGGRVWTLTELNTWTTGSMYVPAARLWSVPTAGGELTKVMDLEGIASLAADETSLYVAVGRDLSLMNTPRASAPSGRIFRLPLAGGALVDLVKEISPRLVAVDGDTLWFDGARMPKDGGEPQPSGVIAPAFAMAFDEDNVYFTSGKGPSDPPKPGKNGRVLRMSKKGGAPVVLATGLPDEPAGLALDRTHVYASATAWGTAELAQAGVVARVPKAGGALEVLANAPELRGAWVSGDHVYVRSGRPGRPGAILRVSKTAAAAERVLEDPTLCFMTMDATSIYFSTDGTFRADHKRLTPAVIVRLVR